MSNEYQIGARALAYYGLTAAWRRHPSYEPSVIVTAAAATDEGVYEPAQSVTISSRAGLIALREVIDEVLRDADAEDGAA